MSVTCQEVSSPEVTWLVPVLFCPVLFIPVLFPVFFFLYFFPVLFSPYSFPYFFSILFSVLFIRTFFSNFFPVFFSVLFSRAFSRTIFSYFFLPYLFSRTFYPPYFFFPYFSFPVLFTRTFSNVATFEIQRFEISVSCFSRTCRYNTGHVPCGIFIQTSPAGLSLDGWGARMRDLKGPKMNLFNPKEDWNVL